MNAPEIEPIKVTGYETKQSTYSHCGKLPIRSIVLGPSGSGKNRCTNQPKLGYL